MPFEKRTFQLLTDPFSFIFLSEGKRNKIMKTLRISFYSNSPRLKVNLAWTTDLVPNVGDEIRIESKFISQVDKLFFGKNMIDCDMTFRVKKRLFFVGEKKDHWKMYDGILEIGWTEEEEKEVDKYLEKRKKERGKKKIKEKD